MFIEQFSRVLKEKHSHMLIMGDFNYPEIDWKLQISRASSNHPSQDFILSYKDWFLYRLYPGIAPGWGYYFKPTKTKNPEKKN